MHLIDTHAHLTFPELAGQIDGVLGRCAEAGVGEVITIGTQLADARAALALARRFPGRIHAGVGFHPHEANGVTEDDLHAMRELWDDPYTVAIGEMGLDYHYDFAERDAQQRVFAGQLALARPLDKPVVIHCREALDDTIDILTERGFAGRPVVFHCFSGTAEEAERIGSQGWRVSFTGIVTFRKSRAVQDAARRYPLEQLMVETDSPYLSPEPVRGRRPNEPAHVRHTVRFLAGLRNLGLEEMAARTAANARSFFGLGRSGAAGAGCGPPGR